MLVCELKKICLGILYFEEGKKRHAEKQTKVSLPFERVLAQSAFCGRLRKASCGNTMRRFSQKDPAATARFAETAHKKARSDV
jgi:hypothetical protein